MIRHLVALDFKPDVSAEKKQDLMGALAELRDVLDGILDFQVAQNISNEEVRGFHDLFWFDFSDVIARDAYLSAPEHQRIGMELVMSCIGGAAGIRVYDFKV